MEYKHIEYFIETCNHKSITKAAESMFISQQALSRCIAKLEEDINCKLFNRTVKGITLTKEGKYLYEQFNPIIMNFRNTVSKTMSAFENRPKTLSFCCAYGIFRSLNPELIMTFQEKNPKIKLDMLEMSDKECDEYVESDKKNFGLLAIAENRHGERLDYITVKTVPLYLFVNKNNPLSKCKEIKFEMLKNESFLFLDKKSYYRKLVNYYSKKYDFKPKPIFESSDTNQLCSLVDKGKGVFLGIPELYNKALYKNTVIIPFEDKTINWSIAFIFQNYDYLDISAKKFIEYVIENS
ncbi:MAG: LysR family transcriptional regulator [Lachnospirales bacterium]